MFERQLHDQITIQTSHHAAGGVAPSRNAIQMQRYLEKRRVRLQGESAERERQADNLLAARIVAVLRFLTGRAAPAEAGVEARREVLGH